MIQIVYFHPLSDLVKAKISACARAGGDAAIHPACTCETTLSLRTTWPELCSRIPRHENTVPFWSLGDEAKVWQLQAGTNESHLGQLGQLKPKLFRLLFTSAICEFQLDVWKRSHPKRKTHQDKASAGRKPKRPQPGHQTPPKRTLPGFVELSTRVSRVYRHRKASARRLWLRCRKESISLARSCELSVERITSVPNK